MVFWFQFPISSLSQFDKVTSRCHLLYPTPFAQAPWNAISNMKYCPDRLQLFQRGKHQCLLFRNQALAPGASHYLSSLGREGGGHKSPTGIYNPLLVCASAKQNDPSRCLQFAHPNEIINAKTYLFCWIKSLIHSNSPPGNCIVIAFLYETLPDCRYLNGIVRYCDQDDPDSVLLLLMRYSVILL